MYALCTPVPNPFYPAWNRPAVPWAQQRPHRLADGLRSACLCAAVMLATGIGMVLSVGLLTLAIVFPLGVLLGWL